MLLQGTFGGDFDNFTASGESNALLLLWNTQLKTHWVSVCLVAEFDFQHRM